MLSNEQIAFIQQNSQANPTSLRLKYGKEKEFVIAQIEARQKARTKLPSWCAEPRLVFPPAVSVEQSSSEATARYKADIMSQTASKTIVDGTGGMGIDSYYFSKHFESVTYIEQNEKLVERARHNFDILNTPNIECICNDSIAFLQRLTGKVDWLYLDPARRTADQRRVVGLGDCEPDVTKHLTLFLEKAHHILVKVSPLLDLTQTLLEVPQIRVVHVVAVENECKELLLEIGTPATDLVIKTINFKNDGSQQIFDFYWSEESDTVVEFSTPLRYIYEPNAAILKAGAFKTVAAKYQIAKIAPHSHLYTSERLVRLFPGRTFELIATVKADNKALTPYLTSEKANLTLRNFPGTTDELRKKLKLKDGGDVYLLATTLANADKRLLVCRKVKD
ncbi:class I SAM-dependent methyltransferase [Runella salmonicolor]|uniref:RsmD family RNA methyltransferase n=1 Tax=Runella salmonicolor TaxID=2950278 RepID=A0ABT1FLP7_9BACT|nr:class I SAM-dependent methyltransferase [Runella salmonicolor]MCP1382684.1 RsmD family RNA methyltransferase [Runella salmonicolor]